MSGEPDIHAKLDNAIQRASEIRTIADEMRQVLDLLEHEIDHQTYDEFRKAEFDLPGDAELNINLTAGLICRLSKVLGKADRVLGPIA